MTPLLYSNNADIKYPLSDFHTEDIPNDILLDVSLSVPPDYEAVVGAVRVGLGFAFVSIENKADRRPIGHVLVQNPVVARVYPLDMDVPGFGWVVWGPGAASGKSYYSGDVSVDLDPEAVIALKRTGLSLGLRVNTFEQDVNEFIELLSGSDTLAITREGSTIYLDRNDEALTEDDITALNLEQQAALENQEQVVYTVAGTPPDAEGNIDIIIVGCVSDCGDVRELTIPRGDTAQGETGELPLDIFAVREYVEGDPCAPSDLPQESSEPFDPYAGCTNITRVDIIDATQGIAIGTLYTAEGTV